MSTAVKGQDLNHPPYKSSIVLLAICHSVCQMLATTCLPSNFWLNRLLTPPETPLFRSLDDEDQHIGMAHGGRAQVKPISISRSSTVSAHLMTGSCIHFQLTIPTC